jgi:hypothetical protein
MEIIDKSKVAKDERFIRETNEMLESLVKEKDDKVKSKYIPDEAEKAYLHAFKDSMLNRLGKSKDGSFAVVASFPIEVHVDMTNKYGPHWVDKPGVLQDFLAKNPHYRMGTVGLGFQGGQGSFVVNGDQTTKKEQ